MLATIWPTVPITDDNDDECLAVGGMRIGRENEIVPLLLWPPHVPYE
jgi:hypothetical protein